MIDQTIIVEKILTELNRANIPTSQVERDLEIASGYLWKVKKGKKTLGEEKMKALDDYHAKYCIKIIPASVIKTPIIFTKGTPLVEKIQIKEVKPGSLADMMKEVRSAPGREVAKPYTRSKI